MNETQITVMGGLFGIVLLIFLCNLRRRTWRILQNQNLFRKYVRFFYFVTGHYFVCYFLRLMFRS